MTCLAGEGRSRATLIGLVCLLRRQVLVGNVQSQQFIHEHPKREYVNLVCVHLSTGGSDLEFRRMNKQQTLCCRLCKREGKGERDALYAQVEKSFL